MLYHKPVKFEDPECNGYCVTGATIFEIVQTYIKFQFVRGKYSNASNSFIPEYLYKKVIPHEY